MTLTKSSYPPEPQLPQVQSGAGVRKQEFSYIKLSPKSTLIWLLLLILHLIKTAYIKVNNSTMLANLKVNSHYIFKFDLQITFEIVDEISIPCSGTGFLKWSSTETFLSYFSSLPNCFVQFDAFECNHITLWFFQ